MAQTYEFSDAGRPQKFLLIREEVYVSIRPGADRTTAMQSLRKAFGLRGEVNALPAGEAGLVLQLGKETQSVRRAIRDSKLGKAGISGAAPVFYDAESLPSGAKLAAMSEDARAQRRQAARRIMTAKLLVKMDNPEKGWSALQSTKPSEKAESLVKGWYLISYADPYAAFDAVERLSEESGWEFIPVFARQFETKQKASGSLQRPVNDPLFSKQWHLNNDTGIHMNASWDVATGKGINITVVDDGLDISHEDLGNAYPLSSGNHRNFNAGVPNDPTPSTPDQNHGTSCAGLIAATGFNNLGVIGVAPEARLMGLRLIADPSADDAIGAAMSWQPAGIVTHVSSNSWGPADDGMDPGRLGALQAAGIEKAATTYRNGLGTVFAVSAGNGRQSGDDSSYDEFASSRFVIAVGAVNRQGQPSSFSEQGINVAVSAFGGEFNPPDVLWTTNNSGPDALDALQAKFDSSAAPVNYSDAFNGTSAAAPQVSGTAALLLEKNPRLGYRDVKEILMRSASKDGLSGGDDFSDNGSGLTFSHSFGAGVINVSAALDMADGWKNLGPATSIAATAAGSQEIPDGSIDGATFSFDFSGAQKLRVEHVEVSVNVQHANRGDIGFIMESPSGMLSIVNNRAADSGANFADYKLTSVRHWGESSAGVWKVRVIDAQDNGVAGRAGMLTMRIYGAAQ